MINNKLTKEQEKLEKQNQKDKKEIDDFFNEQLSIGRGHMERCFHRCYNKFMEVKCRDKENG